MKKALILLISILLLVLTACSHTDTANNTASNDSIVPTKASERTEASKAGQKVSDIEEICLYILGETYKVSADSETKDSLKASKTVTEPLADDLDLQEIGTVSIIYKGSDSKEEFGKAYIKGTDIYIQSKENKYGAVVKFYTLSSTSTSKSSAFDTIKSIYGNIE